MDGHKHCRCCVQCPHCEIAELRWAIDDDDVVVIAHLVNRACQPPEEEIVPALASLDHGSGCVVLKLHKFEVTWNQANAIEIRRSNNLAHWATLIVIPDGAVDRFVLPDVEFGLIAKHRR